MVYQSCDENSGDSYCHLKMMSKPLKLQIDDFLKLKRPETHKNFCTINDIVVKKC